MKSNNKFKLLSILLSIILLSSNIFGLNMALAQDNEAKQVKVSQVNIIVQDFEDSNIKVITVVSGKYKPLPIANLLDKAEIKIGNDVEILSRSNSSVYVNESSDGNTTLNLSSENASEYPIVIRDSLNNTVIFRFSKEFALENNFKYNETEYVNYEIGEENKTYYHLNYLTYNDYKRGLITVFGKNYDKSRFKLKGEKSWDNNYRMEDKFSLSKISDKERLKYSGHADNQIENPNTKIPTNSDSQNIVNQNNIQSTDLGKREILNRNIPKIENEYLDWIPNKLNKSIIESNKKLFSEYTVTSKNIIEQKIELNNENKYPSLYSIPVEAISDGSNSFYYSFSNINELNQSDFKYLTNRVLLDLINKVNKPELVTQISAELSDRLNIIAEESMKVNETDKDSFSGFKTQSDNTKDWGESIKEDIKDAEDTNNSYNTDTSSNWNFWGNIDDTEDTTDWGLSGDNIIDNNENRTTEDGSIIDRTQNRELTPREKEGYKLGKVKEGDKVEDILDDKTRLTKHGYSDSSILMDSVYDIRNQKISPADIPVPKVVAVRTYPLVLDTKRPKMNAIPYMIGVLICLGLMLIVSMIGKNIIARSIMKDELKNSIKFNMNFEEFDSFNDKKLDI